MTKDRTSQRHRALARRDGGWICWLCGQEIDPEARGAHARHGPSSDHVIPRSEGGTGAMANLRLAHRSCNEHRSTPTCVPFAPPLAT